jgi:glycosyltransferase involved in cell wall biosynthesis
MLHPPSASIVVAIPARNEADRIGACLRALREQVDAPPFDVVVLANNCTDATASLAGRWADRLAGLQVACCTLPPDLAHAGEARRRAMMLAAERSTPDGVLLTTDADSVAPPGWIAANLAALRGVDAVAGRAVIDPREAALIPRHLHALDARECRYAALLDRIAALLAPDPHDPWPRHDEHSGASIAVRLPAYLAAGGIPRQPSGEDRAFFAALRASGARIRHAPEVWVTVSGRLVGRARGGMADTIRARIAAPPVWLDDRLMPVADWVARLTGGARRPARRISFAALDGEMRLGMELLERLERGPGEARRLAAE